MNEQLERIVHNSNVRNYVCKLEYPCESMSDPSSRNCFRGVLLLANENDDNSTDESPGENLIFPVS